MKKIVTASLLSLSILSVGNFASADTWVNGYFRSDGTYVDSHFRSDSDGYFYNNYSTYGNTNPYTGDRGYKTYDYSSGYDSSYDSSYDDYSNDYDYSSYDSSYDSYDDDYNYNNTEDDYGYYESESDSSSFWGWFLGY